MNALLDRLLRRARPLRGGVFLPMLGPVATGRVEPFSNPAVLTIPLQQHDGPAAVPVIQAGQFVQAGQIIGRAESPDALYVHASVAGRVSGFTRVDTAHHTDVPAIQIETAAGSPADPSTEIAAADESARQDWTQAHAAGAAAPQLDTMIRTAEQAGLISFQKPARGLAQQLKEASQADVAHLIINTLAGEPICSTHAWSDVPPWPTLLRVGGWIGDVLEAEHLWVVADRTDRRASRELRAFARNSRFKIVELINKYPQHHPVLLAHRITGLEPPPGQGPLAAGALVLEAEAILHLDAALRPSGEASGALTHRTVTVAGPAVLRPGRYRLPLGTRLADVLQHVGLRHTPKQVIDGGPLTGRAVSHLDVVTTKQTAALIALDRSNDHVPAPGPCVRCGWCQEDCPVGLDPQMLLNLAEQQDIAGAAAYYPQACIECGVCSYVCPAELPLAENAARLKRWIQPAVPAGSNETTNHCNLTGVFAP